MNQQQYKVQLDQHGYFMDVTIAGVIQRFRWIPPGQFVEGYWLADKWGAVMVVLNAPAPDDMVMVSGRDTSPPARLTNPTR